MRVTVGMFRTSMFFRSILPAVDGIVYCRRKLVRSRVEKPGLLMCDTVRTQEAHTLPLF